MPRFDANNAAYLEALYEQYLQNPLSIPAELREYFEQIGEMSEEPHQLHTETRAQFRRYMQQGYSGRGNALDTDASRKQVHVLQFINAHRFLGHFEAEINPLGHTKKLTIEELKLEHHGFDQQDLKCSFNIGSLHGPAQEMTLEDIRSLLRCTYCNTIGAQYMHITSTANKRWIQQRLETAAGDPGLSDRERRSLLVGLTEAETLERYLHHKYVGQKRFSLEGGESLIPMLDTLINHAAGEGVEEIVFGMAHRGRLNVLVNILGKAPATLFAEFEGTASHGGRTGDVKYHMGFACDRNTPHGPVHLALAFNPSHLEIVGPVVVGGVRARQDRRREGGDQVVPVVIHGDAAFAGQGVVMETLNMSETRGYRTHGTIHIVVNNQIGFTTSSKIDARSTHYCSDVAKMVGAPVFHVNGDDPEAVAFVVRAAFDYRKEFHEDVVIDMVCYRRHGHNEADEPAATQPQMYRKIRSLPTTRECYAKRLVEEGVVTEEECEHIIQGYRRRLEDGEPTVPSLIDPQDIERRHPVNWSKYRDGGWEQQTGWKMDHEHFVRLGGAVANLPDSLRVNGRVSRIYADRLRMSIGSQQLDWGFCENLAYAALLEYGYGVRISGQDCGRGTFFHRHAVVHDQESGDCYIPLQHLSPEQPPFQVIDSLLSEEAVLAFEYGYATTEADTLVVWEAQFGDFANGAQVVIDQFITSGGQKWGRLSGLVMFLPHGYDGQGPEHSSARLERYLQLCAQENIQVCVPSTPSQIFHMLMRQMLRRYRKPLIVMTPKSLLRHPLCLSRAEEVMEGSFQTVLDEQDEIEPEKVERIVLCSGKVYYDLLEGRRSGSLQDVAILRIEQLYPFPHHRLEQVLQRYSGYIRLVWCQEEPLNQGAWFMLGPLLQVMLKEGAQLTNVGRPASAAPAVGSYHIHQQQQRDLVSCALGLDGPRTCDEAAA